ncbi:bifunctional thymidylate/uridylate kinase [Rhodotorula paludigena]|uniref:bifunctional thymidylate/uridylate kinase n=1 Tax=Rhodotorula paludigena TaxID=86838 RepID=UPI00317244F3
MTTARTTLASAAQSASSTLAAGARQRRGAFIVFEGLDRSGKSTQVARLVQQLNERGVKAVAARFPDRTLTTGKMIDSYLSQKADLDDRAIHLLFSANRWERANQILEDLNRGTTVVCDRYAFSGIAFSAIKGLSWSWCRAPDIGLPAPDLVLFLRISPSAAQSRGGFGDERYEKTEVQQRVEGAFKRLGESVEEGKWVELEADRGVDEVGQEVLRRVEEVLHGEGLDKDVGKLWTECQADD